MGDHWGKVFEQLNLSEGGRYRAPTHRYGYIRKLNELVLLTFGWVLKLC